MGLGEPPSPSHTAADALAVTVLVVTQFAQQPVFANRPLDEKQQEQKHDQASDHATYRQVPQTPLIGMTVPRIQAARRLRSGARSTRDRCRHAPAGMSGHLRTNHRDNDRDHRTVSKRTSRHNPCGAARPWPAEPHRCCTEVLSTERATLCPRSSAGESSGLLIRGSQVRILAGAPVRLPATAIRIRSRPWRRARPAPLSPPGSVAWSRCRTRSPARAAVRRRAPRRRP